MRANTPVAAGSAMELAQAGRFDNWLKKYATPLTMALGVVVCVTGVMMFYRFYKGEVAAMHEWLGLAFVAATVLHLLRHRKSLTRLFADARTQILLVVVALVSVAFIVFPSAKEGNLMRQTVGAVLRAPIGDVAPVLGVSAAEVLERVAQAGVGDATAAESLEALARAHHMEPVKLLSAVVNPPRRPDDLVEKE
ncbi:DUF4405 domain-containing protein [Propionivibrio limicola]|uniref:DUF4405 domain-containing protein n=1 Tax=Propionivibrio limicola TaxID=167645 RepID=UPI00147899FE|nr:DUF4405 domain-containing protein [Propionivibrio limicola]